MKIILLIVTALLAIGSAGPVIAGDPAGEIVNDSMFVDGEYKFSFTIPNTWKFQTVYDKGDIDRVVLLQSAPVVPAQFTGEMRSFFTQPQVTILGCPSKKLVDHLKPKHYLEFLLAEKGKDDLKKKAHGRFQLLQMDSEYTFQYRKVRAVKVGGHHAAMVAGKKKYYYAFENELRRANVQSLNDYISGVIYAVETEDGMLVIELVCEREMKESLDADFDRIVDSFLFEDKKAKAKKESDG